MHAVHSAQRTEHKEGYLIIVADGRHLRPAGWPPSPSLLYAHLHQAYSAENCPIVAFCRAFTGHGNTQG